MQQAKKKLIHYLTAFRQEGKLNFQLATVPGARTLVCLEINTALNGWWTLQATRRNKVCCALHTHLYFAAT